MTQASWQRVYRWDSWGRCGTCALLARVRWTCYLSLRREGVEEEGREHAMDEHERQLRQAAQQAHNDLVQAQKAAKMLPPIEWGEWATCATAGCGNRTAAYWKMADGALTPVCGACVLTAMDQVIE